jgi:GNAT superfamily N-acetyltransferase
MEAVRIRPADPQEGERLREIAMAAKSHWGYELEWVRRWAAAGDFSAEALRGEVFVAEADGRAVAWAALVPRGGGVVWLDDLWVEPAWMGTGIGSRLFRPRSSGRDSSGESDSSGRPSRTRSASTPGWEAASCARATPRSGVASCR